MCNHYKTSDPERVLEFARAVARISQIELWKPTENAWPKAMMPVVYDGDERTLGVMRWGVWPWYEKAMPSRPVVNARDDKLVKSPAWRESVAKRRVLVPADGFLEFTGPVGRKWEVLFELPNRRPFFFAGIYSADPTGDGRGFAIVTSTAHPAVATLPHDRTPVILDERAAAEWIGSTPLPPDRLTALCATYAGELVRTDLPPPTRPIRKADLPAGEISLN